MPSIWRSLKTETLGWSQGRWAVHSLSGFTSPVSLVEVLRHLRSLHNFLYISNSHFQFLKGNMRFYNHRKDINNLKT